MVFAAAAGVALAWRRCAFSNLSLALLALFGALHAYGAHYTYSETPFGDFLRGVFALDRNPYDRLVHFAFGLLPTYLLREVSLRVLHVRRAWTWVLPLLGALAISASYELVESWAARIAAPELRTAFLGTQGDEWDAQKDMGAALAGALCALGATAVARRLVGREPWIAGRSQERLPSPARRVPSTSGKKSRSEAASNDGRRPQRGHGACSVRRNDASRIPRRSTGDADHGENHAGKPPVGDRRTRARAGRCGRNARSSAGRQRHGTAVREGRPEAR